ncbi:TPA: two-component sensor histidine kinase [Candidatus Gastranaerophilales bacterium HUM_20]|nr:gAF sensor signal transduction histidine kinase [Clostridium sp. CAG:729]DAB24999.1 MAG TPA: two-component sensor histidine kinase [Candidatus Gastranaerophilales bacterium HUM_20]
MEFFKFKRLKIVEQIAVVFIFAVIIPMSISGFIINNINQQSMRYQLRESAVLIANMVSDEIDFFNKTVSSNLEQIVFSLNYFKTQEAKNAYLKSVVQKLPDCEELVVADAAHSEEIHERNKLHKKATVNLKISDGQYLVATYKMDAIKDELFKSIADDKRQIYVLTNEGDLIAEHNYTDEAFKKTVSLLPKKLKKNKPEIFGDIKNQPLVYVSKDEPKITIIVNTTEKVTLKAITNNSLKIILSCLFATFAIIFIVALYIYYLYINIRQLFKGIIAISKGNYERQIRLLTTAFTPHEIVFLAFEFNRMATEIHKSYIQLKKNNVELKQLNEFRSNLIDTVSHELRTPLTSIQGYTSRLMRQDIKIDEETRQKSLRIIKEQSERLKRLIEDLLTIPDIEGMRLRTKSEDVYLPEVLEEAKILIKNKEEKEIVYNISEDLPLVDADKDRLIQVCVNLLDNAAKYARPDTKIVVDTVVLDDKVKFFVKNDCDVIPPAKLKKLFEKFIRLDDNTTRTTRGTGLGLFIVKGLIEAMNGEIDIHSDKNCGFCVEVTLRMSQVAEAVK